MKIIKNFSEISTKSHSDFSPKEILLDNFGRRINYVRLSVTDRCNLRCTYCMPGKGIQFIPRDQILSYEEMERLLTLLTSMGITKVRITGGEPFVRKNLMEFLHKINTIPGIQSISLTTNGVLTAPYLPELKKIGIKSINLSMDTIDRERFLKITRRDSFDRVMKCFHKIMEEEIPLKINMVVIEGLNETDIILMSHLAKKYPVGIRFIEEMPFNGTNGGKARLNWNYQRIFKVLQEEYPNIYPLESEPTSTSMNYCVPGHAGTLGIIAGFSRTFCGTCNRIRITARGTLQTCLYGEGVLDIKQWLRSGVDDDAIKTLFRKYIGRRFRDGWEAEKHRNPPQEITESMAVIGG
jgi:cyclic pyranopterin phosphate synthase